MPKSPLTLTLDDLRTWKSSGTAPSAPPPIVAVIGDPIKHSLSPAMHQPALDHCGINGAYVKLHIPADVDSLDETFNLLSDLGFRGVNVTVPHKENALNAATSCDAVATEMNVANTIRFLSDGTSRAFNTDGIGLTGAIRDAFQIDLSSLKIAVIGAGGGAGRAAAVTCAMADCDRLVLVNRTISKVEPLRDQLAPYFKQDRLEGAADRLSLVALDEIAAVRHELESVELIINATSVGLAPGDSSPLPAGAVHPHHLVFDMIYSPPKTPLLRDAESAGARIANGSRMLLHQGAASFNLWFDCEAPLKLMEKGLRDASGA